jgi:N-acetyl-anhydromuramyl-L-alanine amidase AmpD
MGDNENYVSTSTSNRTLNTLTIGPQIKVTVRRDFPLRQGEKHGDWQWSARERRDGRDVSRRVREPMRWRANQASIAPDQVLTAQEPREIWGWNVGTPVTPGNEGDAGGEFTTDNRNPIAATVQLFIGGLEIASGRTSGADGAVLLNSGGQNGEGYIRITPDDCDDTHPVGPELANDAGSPALLYRSAIISVHLRSGFISEVLDPYDPPAAVTHARIGNRKQWEPKTDHLPVSLKPVWWKDPGSSIRPATPGIDMFIIHCTGGPRLGSALNRFFRTVGPLGAGVHYIMEQDGHIIKLVHESKLKTHAGGRWEQTKNNVQRSIGIEIFNPSLAGFDEQPQYATRGAPSYTSEQLSALCFLLKRLIAAYPAIGHRILGHSDVAVGNAHGQSMWAADEYGTERNWDPGPHFPWELPAREGLGMIPQDHFSGRSDYDGVFSVFAGVVLRENDRDLHGTAKARYGGQERPGYSGQPIEKLKQDLLDIGYSLHGPLTGTFDRSSAGAVDRFKRHFMRSLWNDDPNQFGVRKGDIDQAAAACIRNVAEEVRLASRKWECWIYKPEGTRAKQVKLAQETAPEIHAGIIGVFDNRHEAETEKAAGTVWQQGQQWECWLYKPQNGTRAMRVRLSAQLASVGPNTGLPAGVVGMFGRLGDQAGNRAEADSEKVPGTDVSEFII